MECQQECQKAFDIIKDLCTKPLFLNMPNQTGKFHLESDTSREGVGWTLYQLQNDSWLLIGYHSKKLPDAVRKYGVAELELTGLYVNIHGFIHILQNRYFEILVDHRVIKYMKKAKHEATTKILTVLLLKLQDFQFDLKYMQGAKMYVSDALSRLYTEENHKITDIIPLNFLQHTADNCTNDTYKYCTQSLYRHDIAINKSIDNNRKRGRPPIGKNCSIDKTITQVAKQAISMVKQTDKNVNNSMAPVTNTTINTKHPGLSDNTMNINPSNFNTNIASTVDNISDMSNIDSSKLLTTYWPPDIELFNNENSLVTPDTPINLMHKHIPQQSEVNEFLKNIRTKVLHTTQLPIQTESLITEYSKSSKFRQIYQYIKNGYIKGPQSIRKRIQLEAQEYILLNDILCKINHTDNTNQSESNLLIVIPEKYFLLFPWHA